MKLYNKELIAITLLIVGLTIIQQCIPKKTKKEGFADTALTAGLTTFVVAVLLLFGAWILYTSYKLNV